MKIRGWDSFGEETQAFLNRALSSLLKDEGGAAAGLRTRSSLTELLKGQGPQGQCWKIVLGIAPWWGLCWVPNFPYFLLVHLLSLCKWCWQEAQGVWRWKERAFPNKKDMTLMWGQVTYISAKRMRVRSIITPCTGGAKPGGSLSNGFQRLWYPKSALTLGHLAQVKLKE